MFAASVTVISASVTVIAAITATATVALIAVKSVVAVGSSRYCCKSSFVAITVTADAVRSGNL